MTNNFTAIVLAAGKGVRMKSSIPKVLHNIGGKPMISYVLKELITLDEYIKQIIIVVGYQGKLVEEKIKEELPKIQIEFAYQKNLLGTANAVRCAEKKVKYNNVLVLCGDTPLITKDTLLYFIKTHREKKSVGSLITAQFKEKNELGVIIRDKSGNVMAIRERINLPQNENHEEINSGIYIFDRKILFRNLKKIKKNNKKGEYFFTDIIELLYKQKYIINSLLLDNKEEVIGINTPLELCSAERIIHKRIINAFIDNGIKIIDPDTTFIEEGVKIGENTIIYPFTFIEKNVIINNCCLIGPFAYLKEGAIVKEKTKINAIIF